MEPQDPRHLDAAVSCYHKLLRNKLAGRFSSLRRSFRQIDADASGTCDRGELKFMLAAMFSLDIPGAVMDRLIDLADYDGDGQIKFNEFARIFSSDDVRTPPTRSAHTVHTQSPTGHCTVAPLWCYHVWRVHCVWCGRSIT